MKIFKSVIVFAMVIGVFFSAGNVFAAIQAPKVLVVLNGEKCIDSKDVNPIHNCFMLELSCVRVSPYPIMGVLRGRQESEGPGVWLSGTALKCPIGTRTSKKYNVYTYAKNHGIVSYTNFVGIRLYGNHCDNQKRGAYGNGLATNMR